MSREIKFRGKRIDNGAWADGTLLKGKTDDEKQLAYVIPCGTRYEVMNGVLHRNTPLFEVDSKTVGQYTGLKDKNGLKEIYDDDIVKNSYLSPLDNEEKSHIWVVKYETGMYWLRHILGMKHYDSSLLLKFTRIEVIGNIHDNPELLEQS